APSSCVRCPPDSCGRRSQARVRPTDSDWGHSARRCGGTLGLELLQPLLELIRLRLVLGGPLRPAGCAAGAGRLWRCRLGGRRSRAGLAPGEELIERETAGLRPVTWSL